MSLREVLYFMVYEGNGEGQAVTFPSTEAGYTALHMSVCQFVDRHDGRYVGKLVFLTYV